jgi:multicomponent K+:H+ antiporter subunit E
MKRWLPHPGISLLIVALWLLLQQSVSAANLLAALAIGVALPRLVDGLIGLSSRPRRGGTALRLAGVVLYDIVRSNLTVARIVLSPASRPQPAWVPVPLDLRHPTAIALLASMVTNTPGTVSCVVDEREHLLLVHALDTRDPQALAAEIKQRYEQPLKEMFE